MKFLIIFLTFFTIIAGSSFAKSGGAYSKSEEKVVDKLLSNQDHIADTEIKPFDFAKLFSEAESYYHSANAWKKLKCEPKSGFLCAKRECVKKKIKTYVILDKEAATITRCDKDICETIKGRFDQTGVFFNITSQGPVGTLIRVLGDSRYKEISSIGLDAYITNGNCQVIPE